jgi:hypothetical protein
MGMNLLSMRGIRPNCLMGVQITPTSHEIAVMDLAPEYGEISPLVINRAIAENLIEQCQAFLNGRN